MTVVHWDDRPGDDLALAAGADWACLRHLTIGPGQPLHLDAEERETVAWLLGRDLVVSRRPGDIERSLRAEGPTGLLVFAAGAPLAPPPDTPEPVIVQIADLPRERVRDGRTAIVRRDVGTPAGALAVVVELVDVDPDGRAAPVLDQEEVSVVLAGGGRVRLATEEVQEVRTGSVVTGADRFAAGPDGLRLLTFRRRRA